MSGHSKWHNIQVRKGKQDKTKSSQFTKYGRLITVAAREGGGDPVMNFSLRLAIDKAKAINMPKDNIERAIKKGTGELNDGTTFEEVVYEGFGSGGVGILVDTLTDNKNRTVGDLKSIFSKHGGSLAGAGSVQWQFMKRAVVRIGKEKLSVIKNADEFELSLIDAGADDIEQNEYGMEILAPIANFQKVLEVVTSKGIEPDESGLEWVAKETMVVDDAVKNSIQSLYEALDDHDDVRGVYTNVV